MAEMVRVNTAVLKTKADDFRALTVVLQKDFAEFQRLVDHTRGYWAGQAADQYRRSFAEKQTVTDMVLHRLEKYPRDLLTMAGLYEQNESRQTNTASALKTNYI